MYVSSRQIANGKRGMPATHHIKEDVNGGEEHLKVLLDEAHLLLVAAAPHVAEKEMELQRVRNSS
jgi:hypothetical protein